MKNTFQHEINQALEPGIEASEAGRFTYAISLPALVKLHFGFINCAVHQDTKSYFLYVHIIGKIHGNTGKTFTISTYGIKFMTYTRRARIYFYKRRQVLQKAG